eukprot:476017-Prorocentrum_minimum.AAC.1
MTSDCQRGIRLPVGSNDSYISPALIVGPPTQSLPRGHVASRCYRDLSDPNDPNDPSDLSDPSDLRVA